MAADDTRDGGMFEAIDGSHLHWSDFRENVLQAFRISCTSTPAATEFPEPFLAELHAAQKNFNKHDAQRQTWRRDVSAGRGLTSLAVFPPSLLPSQSELSPTLRCMLPRMSREGLPLRLPNSKNPLYELPTAKPIYVFGFSTQTFNKFEQAHLTGALHVTGVLVDFLKGEILSSRSLCCPFLAFERFTANSKEQIETARNSCAITGAQCLRGQQQLFHKAFGLQTVLQPPITFTCAVSNEQAILNYHFVGEDGEYNMAALCKFNLEDDEHFNTFQVWIEAIESWAVTHLLPRIQRAIREVAHSHPTPPPSPTPSNSSLLSIDTKSGDVLPILNELRRLCPTIAWFNDAMAADTPINSSVAQCGTPLPFREIRSLSLLRPCHSEASPLDNDGSESNGDVVMSPSRISDVLVPVRENAPQSSRNESLTLAQRRLMFSPSLRTSPSQPDGLTTPISPCRPSTLSPYTPGPDMPMSNMNPILVLQRRLDVAIGEVQELRTQVDDLQAQLNGRTEMLEQRLRLINDRQDDTERQIRMNLERVTCSGPVVQDLVGTVDQEMRIPTTRDTLLRPQSSHPITYITPDPAPQDMPGNYHQFCDDEDLVLWCGPLITKDLAIWCLAKIFNDNSVQLGLLALLVLAVCFNGLLPLPDFCVNIMFIMITEGHVKSISHRWSAVLHNLHIATTAMNLNSETEHADRECVVKNGVVFEGVQNDEKVGLEVVTEEIQVEYVPVVLCQEKVT